MNEAQRCLLEFDIVGMCDLWFQVNPHLPQPRNNNEAWIMLHYARSLSESLPEQARCYSHAWLIERGLPSGLPDNLKPKASRLYPHEAKAVGISVKALSPGGESRARAIEKAMSDAVMECYADGINDIDVIKERMNVARATVDT